MCHLKLRNGGNTGVEILERDNQAGNLLRRRDNFEGEFGDDAQRAFRTDHEVQQGVAGRGLGNSCAEVGDLAGRQNNGHGADIIARCTVLDSTHAACVCCDVAADTGKLFTRIRRIQETLAAAVFREVVEQHARLNADDKVFQIVFQNLIHLGGVDEHAAVQRNCTACQTGTGAARGNRNLVFIANLHDCGNLFGAARHNDAVRSMGAINRHFVLAVVRIDVLAGNHMSGSSCLQLFNDFSCQCVVSTHINSLLLKIELLFKQSQDQRACKADNACKNDVCNTVFNGYFQNLAV